MYTQKEQKVIDQAKAIIASKFSSTGPSISSATAAKDFLIMEISSLEHEVFVIVHLTSQHTIIEVEQIFRGTIDGAGVYPREVVKSALSRNSAAVIFAHNHPSGVAEPSNADITITRKLKNALGTVDIRVLDHLIIGGATATSFAERGLL